MKICFLLPCTGRDPIGGLKIVYQYADGLAGRGHDVSIIHPAFMSPDPIGMRYRVRALTTYLAWLVSPRRWRPDSWFEFKNPVRLRSVLVLTQRLVGPADVYVATWWLTAEFLAEWKTPAKKLYLIQHLETWGGPEERVMATWRMPLSKIVIGKWLADIAAEQGQSASYIPNPLDFDRFGCDNPIESRQPGNVLMLYHESEWKGSADGLEAFSIVKEEYPMLHVDLFGVPAPPPALPEWVTYHQTPTQISLRNLYNKAAIFVAPSWTEGWGLPASEAMVCGAAVVATNIGGHREFCVDGKTALLAPVRDSRKLADHILRLINDDATRQEIARNGHEEIKIFNLANALDKFEFLLTREH